MNKQQNIGSAIKKEHKIRFDLEIIASMVENGSKVLDIGCGNGELLVYLKKNKNVDGRGLEINKNDVQQAVKNGLSVINGDANHDLSYYQDQSFDYAILSQTIQTMQNPKESLQEIMRIAKFGIVTLPNFANWKNRLFLALKGRMPVTKTIPYEWYNTPNIHFCSVNDFIALSKELDFKIEKSIYITNKGKLAGLFKSWFLPNFFSEYGIFLLSNNKALNHQEATVTKTKPMASQHLYPVLNRH